MAYYKYKYTQSTYVTGSINGTPYEEPVIYKTTEYYYIKVIKDGKTLYLSTQYRPVVFTKLFDAVKRIEKLRKKYPHLRYNVFSTTCKF